VRVAWSYGLQLRRTVRRRRALAELISTNGARRGISHLRRGALGELCVSWAISWNARSWRPPSRPGGPRIDHRTDAGVKASVLGVRRSAADPAVADDGGTAKTDRMACLAHRGPAVIGEATRQVRLSPKSRVRRRGETSPACRSPDGDCASMPTCRRPALDLAAAALGPRCRRSSLS